MRWIFREKETEELEIILEKSQYDDEVLVMIQYLEKFGVGRAEVVPVKTVDRIQMLKVIDIISVEVDGSQLVIETAEGRLVTTERLYRFKERVANEDLLQVSKQSLINIQHLRILEASFSGNMLALLTNGIKTSVSRRYLKDLEKRLGLR